MIAKGSMYPNSIYYLRTWTLRDLQFVSWVSKVDPEPASTLNPKVKGRSTRVSQNGLCNYRVPDNCPTKTCATPDRTLSCLPEKAFNPKL